MYKEYISNVLGTSSNVSELSEENSKRVYRELIFKSYTGDMVLMHVKDKERLREIYNENIILMTYFMVNTHNKLFYEGFMEAYNEIIQNNKLDAYFETNVAEQVKYIGRSCDNNTDKDNAYDKVYKKCFDGTDKVGEYCSYDIIFTLLDNRKMFIVFEDLDEKNKVVNISREIIQESIDKMILDKYNISKGDK